jgi:asparagine synthase (glutamine-hydrolysing)
MCGIAGVSSREEWSLEVARAAADRMTCSMRHRGPDDQGTQVVSESPERVVIGNTRLAILDLSHAGHQPMHDPETGNWCVLNGEIYNHLEIRAALGERSWRSTSDTETLLYAYSKWGSGCAERLNGMFAAAVYDASRRVLWCTRDHLGVKPFYYYQRPGLFVFASEVKTLLESRLIPKGLDTDGIASYMRFGSVIEPLTLVQGVRSLPPGHWMEVSAGSIVRRGQYWSLAGCAKRDAEEHSVHDLVHASVRAQMLSDVPVACFLSGGIDSSVITACAAPYSPARLRTFTVAFRGTVMDESSHARSVADRYATEHTEVRLSQDEVAFEVPRAVAAMDLPSIDGVNTFIVSRAVRASGVKVVLSGLGGDEVFGGYRSFRLLPIAAKWSKWAGLIPGRVKAFLPGGERGFDLMRPSLSLAERYAVLRALWSNAELVRMGLSPLVSQDLIEDPDPDLPINTRVSLLELGVYMRSVLLRDSDVMSMAHSLELRVPFLDHRIVEHALSNHLAGYGRKDKLLEAFSNALPVQTIKRAKQGFDLPMAAWLKGMLSSYCEAGLEALNLANVLAVPASSFRERFVSDELTWPRYWQLVTLGHWLSRFKDYRAETAMR